jgi:hypothetical protein
LKQHFFHNLEGAYGMARRNKPENELKFEVVDAEPLSEAEMDRLADLFADEIIQKMLNNKRKEHKNSSTQDVVK